MGSGRPVQPASVSGSDIDDDSCICVCGSAHLSGRHALDQAAANHRQRPLHIPHLPVCDRASGDAGGPSGGRERARTFIDCQTADAEALPETLGARKVRLCGA